MQDLLLKNNLATSTPGGEVRQAARVQTITTLGSLDAGLVIKLYCSSFKMRTS